ncbi:MAG: type II toxin-antitoxin system VapC family toxin [Alphaproteobacteria bacterium]|nr:type II toxin-antitoxin system VapC family toxin [Alphaproteobacteria bacterium]
MKGWLLDTNVVSELRKPRCDPNVRSWAARQPASSFHLSCVTIAEIRFGIDRVPPDDPFRHALDLWLERTLRPWFAERILDIDEEVMVVWRRLVELGRGEGYTFAQPDLLIAATATVHDLQVVTRNVGDFRRARVPVLDPWIDDRS